MEKQFIAYFLLASVLGASGTISNCDTEKNISLVTESSAAHDQHNDAAMDHDDSDPDFIA